MPRTGRIWSHSPLELRFLPCALGSKGYLEEQKKAGERMCLAEAQFGKLPSPEVPTFLTV